MEPCGANEDTIPVGVKAKPSKICIKCKEKEAIFLFRAADSTCWGCLEDLLVRKFKSAVIKGRKSKRDIEKYVVAYSGGASSSALLHMLWNTSSGSNTRKKIRLSVVIVHIDESALGLPKEEGEAQEARAFLRQVQQLYTNYEVYDVKLEQLYCPTLHLTRVQSDSNENDNSTTNDKEEEEARHKIKTLFSQSHSVTAKEDLQQRLRSELLQRVGVHLKADSVLLGTPADRAASLLLVNTCLGRGNAFPGAEFPANIHVCVSVLQPMRDFLLKEVAAYNYYSKVPTLFTPSFSTQRPPKSSIFALSESFVNALQADYSHTVHTLLKSEEKLSAPEYIAFNCAICRSPVRANAPAQPAEEKSAGGCGDGGCGSGACGSGKEEGEKEKEGRCGGEGACGSGGCGSGEKKEKAKESRFCYGCSRMMADFDPAAEELLPIAVPRVTLHSMIKDFLIEDED